MSSTATTCCVLFTGSSSASNPSRSARPHARAQRRNLTYRQLAERLEAIGVHNTELNIKNKISRGGFTAVFFVQCLLAIGAHTVQLAD